MINFTKVHALGNDFLLVEDNQEIQADQLPALTRLLCERHTGIGADGLILIKVLDFDRGRVSFRIFNADGSEAEISGNGLRCASAFLFHYQKVPGNVINFETIVGEHLAELISRDNNHFEIRTDMGNQSFLLRIYHSTMAVSMTLSLIIHFPSTGKFTMSPAFRPVTPIAIFSSKDFSRPE